MAKKSRFTKPMHLLREGGNLFRNFFKRISIPDEILEPSMAYKKQAYQQELLSFIYRYIICNLLSYSMLLVNFLISNKYIVAGILIFLLYNSEGIVRQIYNEKDKMLTTEHEHILEKDITIISSKILGKVFNNVYLKQDNFFKLVPSDNIFYDLRSYLKFSWDINTKFIFNILALINILISVVANISINKTIPQSIFIPLLLVSCIAVFFTTLYDISNLSDAREKERILNRIIKRTENDLQNIPLTSHDQEIRLIRLENLLTKQHETRKELTKKDFFSERLLTLLDIFRTNALIVFFLINTKEEITLATLTALIANLSIFNNTLSSFRQLVRLLKDKSNQINCIKEYEPLIEETMKVYNKKISSKAINVTSLDIQPFETRYIEQSENDSPFILSSKDSIQLKVGDIVALIGSSGSGKSTFIKLVTKRIQLKGNHHDALQPTNYMFYDENVGFGRLPIFDELFCLEEISKPSASQEELKKMEYILKKLLLWYEIEDTCKDVWTWLKQHEFINLSNGQKQRLILAKMLFWLDDSIDIIALDECTSGLDSSDNGDIHNADAIKILSFIIDYCNKNKKRIILLSSHQDINNLCNRRLNFKRENGHTYIHQEY